MIYLFPFALDITLGLCLFVGRHSMAERGFDESVVGSIALCFGIGYVISSLLMSRIVSAARSKTQTAVSAFMVAVLVCVLAGLQNVLAIQIAFIVLSFGASLFFNSFQAFVLGIDLKKERSLAFTAGHYTFAWSMGFALGPIITAASRSALSWTQSYLIAAVVSGAVGIGVLLAETRDRSAEPNITRPKVRKERALGPSLIVAAWLCVLFGQGGWVMIATYWPLQATESNFTPLVKGTVEFAFAGMQACGALLAARVSGWHHRALAIPFFGVFALAGLVLFAVSTGSWGFVAGGISYGVFTAGVFSFMVYHSFLEPEKSVKRVSINELVVGAGYMIGPIAASVLHTPGLPFSKSYMIYGIILGSVLAVQTGYILRKHATVR